MKNDKRKANLNSVIKLYTKNYRTFYKYLAIGTSDSPVKDEEIIEIGKKAGIKKGDKVLEPGSGSGGVSRLLAKNFKCEILGIEFVKNQLELAEKNLKKFEFPYLIRYEQGDALTFTYPQDYFDFAIDIFAWIYLPTWEIFFKKIYDSLKVRGKVIIHDAFLTEKTSKETKKIIKDQEVSDSDLCTINAAISKLKKAGFKIVYVEETRNKTMNNWELGLKNIKRKKQEFATEIGEKNYELYCKNAKWTIDKLKKREITSVVIIAKK